MNAERLIGMIVRMVMRKGTAHFTKGQTTAQSKEAQQAAKKLRQAQRLTRKF